MVENRPVATLLSHLVLVLGVLIVAFPDYITFVASTQTAQDIVHPPMSPPPGPHLIDSYATALRGGTGSGSQAPVAKMMTVSLVSALGIAVGKIAISLLSAFAIVYFRFPLRGLVFWMIFVTLMLPVEVRIGPTYQVVSDLGMLKSYAGLTVPDELVEAARIDGAGPLRFFKDVLVPLSSTSIAALFVIQFIYGWNQYLWPLLVTTSEEMYQVVMGIKRMISGCQRQRVAMGRAIVRQPQVFLFDEPLSNLDAKLRAQTRLEIQTLHAELGVTSLFVTHDQVEAMTLAQRMLVMNGGRIEQIGTPEEVYGRPATTFVAGFIGSPPMNLLAGRARAAGFEIGGLTLPLAAPAPRDGAITLGGAPFTLRIDGTLPPPQPGQTVRLAVEARHLHCYDDTGRRVDGA